MGVRVKFHGPQLDGLRQILKKLQMSSLSHTHNPKPLKLGLCRKTLGQGVARPQSGRRVPLSEELLLCVITEKLPPQ